jgi:hypothetical protein
MSVKILHHEFRDGATLVDPTSVKLRDEAGAYGLRRRDTLEVVVDAGEDFTRKSVGVYEYTLTEPARGLSYEYWVEFVYLGETSRFYKELAGTPVAGDLASYCTIDDADAIAAALPGLASYKAADDVAKAAALSLASLDVDAAGPWQGRKYDLSTPQVLEFPRVAYETAASVSRFQGGQLGAGVALVNGGFGFGNLVWDWDAANNVAVVPAAVKMASVIQADAILDGKLAKLLDDLYSGVASKSVGSLSVSYRDPAQTVQLLYGLGGVMGGLTRRAGMLLKKYVLRQGRSL